MRQSLKKLEMAKTNLESDSQKLSLIHKKDRLHKKTACKGCLGYIRRDYKEEKFAIVKNNKLVQNYKRMIAGTSTLKIYWTTNQPIQI